MNRVVLALVLLLVATISSVLYVILNSAAEADKEARVTSEGFVSAVVQDRLQQLATLTKDYAYWDDTISHAYLDQDPAWIEENVGKYLTETFQITDQFIIDGSDKPLLSLREGSFDDAVIGSIDQRGLLWLLGKARESGPDPTPTSGILQIQGVPALVGVSILEPEDETSLPPPRPVLILVKRLDAKLLKALADQYRLNGLALVGEEVEPKQHYASITLTNPLNETLGKLTWAPELPGGLVLSRMQMPLIVMLGITLLLAAVIVNAALVSARRLKEVHLKLQFHANRDELTGLVNRRLFGELLDQEIRQVKRDGTIGALLYCDLDNFKTINDSLGHRAGDRLLTDIAARLTQCVRETDTVARFGGDEFVILLRNLGSRDDVLHTVEKLLDRSRQPFNLSGETVGISISIGVAMVPQDGLNADLLLGRADKALLSSKSSGRSTCHFYADL